jgi:DNA-binding transcriptional regulator/RsmH inhibitor MraZ
MFPNYLAKGSFVGNYAIVKQKGRFGIIDKVGKVVVPAIYSDLGSVSKLVAFTKGKLWGFIDLAGKEVIKPEFDRAESFVNGQAIAEKLTLAGVIDEKGKIIVPFSFVSINRLGENFYLVSSGSKFGLFDNKGKMIVPMEYQQIRMLDNDFLILTTSTEIDYFYIPEGRVIKRKEVNE